MKRPHASPEPATNFSDSSSIRLIPPIKNVPPLLMATDLAIQGSTNYSKLCVSDYSPLDRRHKYVFMRELENGLSVPIFLFTYTHGSNVGNYHFIWHALPHLEEASHTENLRIIQEIREQIPVYHTRAMKREFCELFGSISPQSRPYLLRNIYHTLTHDCSAPSSLSESEIDQRVRGTRLAEDLDIIIDLRQVNSSGRDRFSVFWSKCSEYLSSCTTVHERRHDSYVYGKSHFSS